MFKGRLKLVIITLAILLVGVAIYFLALEVIFSENDGELIDQGPQLSEEEQLIEDKLTYVSKYNYESIEAITSKDISDSQKFSELYSAGSGSIVDGENDAGVDYFIEALNYVDSTGDERNRSALQQYVITIYKTEELSDESKAKIVNAFGQETIDNHSPEGISDEI